jgi:tetratricopeptide (TPR) repeat protein
MSMRSAAPRCVSAVLAALLLLSAPDASAAESTVEEDYRLALTEGARFARDGEYPRALARFKEAVRLRPGEAEARYRLALAYSDLASYATAEEHARKATILEDRFAPGWLLLGTALFYQDKEKEAIEALERALVLDNTNAHAAYMLGRCHYFLGERIERRRRELLHRAAQRNSGEQAAELRTRARDLRREAEDAYRTSRDYFRRTLRLNTGYHAAHFMAGCCYLALDLPNTARDRFQEALAASPDDPEIHFRLGLCYLRADPPRYVDAERSFEEALRHDRDHIDTHLMLGDLYTRHIPEPDKALLHFRRFLRNAPQTHPARARATKRVRELKGEAE